MGQIDNIQDIEENIWIPHMGLKGKVDASVDVRMGTDKGKVFHQATFSCANSCSNYPNLAALLPDMNFRPYQIHAVRVKNRPSQFLIRT